MPEYKDFFSFIPTSQNAIDLFESEWACAFPEGSGVDSGGFASTFHDERVFWARERLGGFEDKRVLELGPLEAGHTYALEKMGAQSILAIEASGKAYLKCLIAKEILNLSHSKFLLGDFVEYLKSSEECFDLIFACGVLYHMEDPVEVIELLSNRCGGLFIWTHYYDEELVSRRKAIADRFGEPFNRKRGEQTYRYYPYSYGDALKGTRFCGGRRTGSSWLREDDLFRALEVNGFKIADARREDHDNGPAVWLAAIK